MIFNLYNLGTYLCVYLKVDEMGLKVYFKVGMPFLCFTHNAPSLIGGRSNSYKYYGQWQQRGPGGGSRPPGSGGGGRHLRGHLVLSVPRGLPATPSGHIVATVLGWPFVM